jgi:serine/threonine protein kinase
MAKRDGLPVKVVGDQASLLMRGILHALNDKFPVRGQLAQKYIVPIAGRHGFIVPEDTRELSEDVGRWFHALPDQTKDNVLCQIVKDLEEKSEFTEKMVSGVLRRHKLTFLQGSFFDTSIKISQYRTVFHGYVAGKQIGEGGNGTVFEVLRDDGKPFAMKLLSKVDLRSSQRDRFSNELWFCATNKHPNIIEVFDWGLSALGGEPFCIMPLLDGSLRGRMKKGLPPNDVTALFRSAIDGVAFAHDRGVSHRDLKPENLLYRKETEALVVADFGIAHFTSETMKARVETKKGARMANRDYAAPEQDEKRGVVDHRADIYALGLILNEMFTGKRIRGPAYTSIAGVAPHYAYLDELVSQMLSENPADRPSLEKIRSALDSPRHSAPIKPPASV